MVKVLNYDIVSVTILKCTLLMVSMRAHFRVRFLQDVDEFMRKIAIVVGSVTSRGKRDISPILPTLSDILSAFKLAQKFDKNKSVGDGIAALGAPFGLSGTVFGSMPSDATAVTGGFTGAATSGTFGVSPVMNVTATGPQRFGKEEDSEQILRISMAGEIKTQGPSLTAQDVADASLRGKLGVTGATFSEMVAQAQEDELAQMTRGLAGGLARDTAGVMEKRDRPQFAKAAGGTLDPGIAEGGAAAKKAPGTFPTAPGGKGELADVSAKDASSKTSLQIPLTAEATEAGEENQIVDDDTGETSHSKRE